MTIPIYRFKPEQEEDVPFEIVRIENIHGNDRFLAAHRTDFYIIYWITHGNGTQYIDFEPYPIKPEILYFITAGQIQFRELTEKLQGVAIFFKESFLSIASHDFITPRTFDFFHRPDLAPVLIIPSDQIDILRDSRRHMMFEFQNKQYGWTVLLQSHLRIFLIHAQRLFVDNPRKTDFAARDQLVEDYIRLIDRYFQVVQRVSEYASRLGVTPGHLTDSTREQLGVSAGHLIQRRIALEAKRQLAHTSQTVGEIAFSLGFSDHSYFSRFFRRESGMTPGQFRQSIREKYQNPLDTS